MEEAQMLALIAKAPGHSTPDIDDYIEPRLLQMSPKEGRSTHSLYHIELSVTVRNAQHVLAAVQVDADDHVDGFVDDVSLLLHLIVDGCPDSFDTRALAAAARAAKEVVPRAINETDGVTSTVARLFNYTVYQIPNVSAVFVEKASGCIVTKIKKWSIRFYF